MTQAAANRRARTESTHVEADVKARMPQTRYDVIGRGYVNTRREDPRIAARIDAALGEARTVAERGSRRGLL